MRGSGRTGPTALTVLLLLAAITVDAQTIHDSLPAFPGAEGFGALTRGGRGGKVYIVTTLEDYDRNSAVIPGSLREAVETEGPRTIVFQTSGYIDLKRPLFITHPFLTIAAQSAPGAGVALKNYGVEVAARQVIIRYLRVRPGDVAGMEQDAINVHSPDVIIDHCSVSWGTDETLSVVGGATNVTIQWCLISESLNNSVHHKGAHGYGTLLTATGDVSIHHTVYALHNSRNPRPKDLLLDFRNNLIYGFGDQAGYNYEDHTRMNYVGNVIRPLDYSKSPNCAFNLGGLNSRFFVADNVLFGPGTRLRDLGPDLPDQDLDDRVRFQTEGVSGDWEFICTPDSISRAEVEAAVRLDTPNKAGYVSTDEPLAALPRLVDGAGAVLPSRDAIDARVVSLIGMSAGRIIDSQEEVGGWLPLLGGEPMTDRDKDGMPDEWENSNGLNSGDKTDNVTDSDNDGYTNIEEFLNGTDPQSHE